MESEVVEVLNKRLYSGNGEAARDLSLLKEKLKITHVIMVMPKYHMVFENEFEYLYIDVKDQTNANIKKFFDKSFKFIENAFNSSEEARVFVHCHLGVSRSASIIISYIMKKKKKSFMGAYEILLDRKPDVLPNDGFIRFELFLNLLFISQLLEYENELNNKEMENTE